MKRAQGIASLAAIGSLTALIALQTGLPAAHADELSDLRANQQLLQQRIDQLAAAQAASGVGEQQAAVTRGANVAGAPSIAGSFPRSFLIPGTNTSIAITGYIKYDATEWFTGGGPGVGAGVAPSVIGLPGVAGAPLNLKGPAGSVTAAPAFNPAKRQYWVFHDSAAESRLRVETRTPTEYGQVGTVLEFDFYGCTADSASSCNVLDNGTFGQLPRLRLAYATLGGFFAGQGFIPVNDLDSSPEIFDFGGDAGKFGFARAPWIGYTWELPYGTSFQVAAVTPGSQMVTPIGALETDCNPSAGENGTNCPAGSPGGFAINPLTTNIPDLNLVFKAEQPWGHVQAGFVLQRESLNDGRFIHQNFVGYGGGLSGSVKPDWMGWTKDNFGWNVYAGDGLGHYANPSGGGEPTTSNGMQSNFGLVGVNCNPASGVGCYGNAAGGPTGDTLANAALVRTSLVPQYGAEANYQHWWLPNLRSTISAGFQTNAMDLNTVGKNTVTLNYNETLWTAHLNLIWSPVSFIDTGLEYVFGERLTLLRQRGQVNALDYAFKVKF